MQILNLSKFYLNYLFVYIISNRQRIFMFPVSTIIIVFYDIYINVQLCFNSFVDV